MNYEYDIMGHGHAMRGYDMMSFSIGPLHTL